MGSPNHESIESVHFIGIESQKQFATYRCSITQLSPVKHLGNPPSWTTCLWQPEGQNFYDQIR